MYVKLSNETVNIYTLGQLRKDNPNTSFPKHPSDELLAEYGVFPYTNGEKPYHDPETQYLTQEFEKVSGKWVNKYLVHNYTEEELAKKLENKRKGATLNRQQFCLACYTAGILSKADAVLAAKGGWPNSFATALSGLNEAQRAAAEIEWASVQTVRRTAPLLKMVQAVSHVTDAELDALFGI